jgi:hypothetical protein
MDDNLIYLKPFRHLLTLDLRWCTQINGTGLKQLSSLTQLQFLWLNGCPLLSGSLKPLTTLTRLKELSIVNCENLQEDECRLFPFTKSYRSNYGV